MPQTYLIAPVTIADVANMIGEGSNDLGTLCESNKINMWAKYKPVVYAKIGILTDNERLLANYGIHYIPTWGLTANGAVVKMMNFWLQQYKTSENQPDCGIQPEYWTYLHPSGGSASPYRLADFVKDTTEGYFHGAVAPVAEIANTTIEITPGGQLNLIYQNGAQSSMTLKYTDLQLETGGYMSLSGYYFGVALIRVADVLSSSATRYVQTEMTASDSISQGAYVRSYFETAAQIGSFMGGTNVDSCSFYIMPFLANGEMYDQFTSGSATRKKFLTSFGSVSADKFVALLERQQVTIVRSYADIKVIRLTSARRSGHTNIIDTNWEVINDTSDYTVTITRMTIEYLDENGESEAEDVITTAYTLDAGDSAIGTSSHTFGSAGSSSVYSCRMTVNTLSGVISFKPSASVKVVTVTG